MTEFIPPGRKPGSPPSSRVAIGFVVVAALLATVIGSALIVRDHYASDPGAYTQFTTIR